MKAAQIVSSPAVDNINKYVVVATIANLVFVSLKIHASTRNRRICRHGELNRTLVKRQNAQGCCEIKRYHHAIVYVFEPTCQRGKTQKNPAVPGFSFCWGGWIRTNAWWSQSPLPYRLATPHCIATGAVQR